MRLTFAAGDRAEGGRDVQGEAGAVAADRRRVASLCDGSSATGQTCRNSAVDDRETFQAAKNEVGPQTSETKARWS